MKRALRAAQVGATLVWFALFNLCASLPLAAQQKSASPTATAAAKPVPYTSWDGKPDLTGVWGPATTGPSPNQDARTAGPEERNRSLAELASLYQPWALERSKAVGYLEDPRLHCGPYGFPRYINLPDYFLLQIVQAPKETAVIVEYTYSAYRVIPTEGSAHPKTIVPSYFGDSVGHWDADTLIVDVTGFNGKIWLDGIGGGGGTTPIERGLAALKEGQSGAARAQASPSGGGWITSDALHEVERWRLIDADTLEYQATVEDPKVLTGAWTTPKYLLKRAPADITPHEAVCLLPEDLSHMQAVAKEEKK
jgi:hypothetical protein